MPEDPRSTDGPTEPGAASDKPSPTLARGRKADPEQYQRFLDTARELGCEDDAGRVNEVIRRAARLSPQRREGGAKAGKPAEPDPIG